MHSQQSFSLLKHALQLDLNQLQKYQNEAPGLQPDDIQSDQNPTQLSSQTLPYSSIPAF